MYRPDAQRAHREALRIGAGVQPSRDAGTPRDQHTNDVGGSQSSERVREGARRRAIEPLGVVDREQRGRPRRAQRRKRRDGDGAFVGRPVVGLLQEQRRPERAALRGWDVLEDVLGDRPDDVSEPRVGEARLGLARHDRDDSHALLASALDGGSPERRLADPGFALHEQDGRVRLAEPPLDLLELQVTADDFRRHLFVLYDTTAGEAGP